MAAPANDNWANALAISFAGSTGISPAISTAESTFEAGEVIPSGWDVGNKSIWFSYTPLTSGTANFDTQLSTPVSAGTDTEMAVYTGTALASLTKVANNSDAGGNNTSLITGFAVTGGVTYWIQVGPFTGADINIVVRIAGPASAPQSPYAQAVLADAPLLYFRAFAGAPLEDFSGNGRALTSQNLDASHYRPPVFPLVGGNSLNFNAANRMVMEPATNNAWHKTGTYSIEAVINIDSMPGSANAVIAAIDVGGQFSSLAYRFSISPVGKLLIQARPSSNPGALQVFYSNTVLVPGTPYHVAVTQNSTTTRMYINGVEDASMAATPVVLSDGVATIGNLYQVPYSEYFPGNIGEVAFYGSALSAARVNAHYLVTTMAPVTEPQVITLGRVTRSSVARHVIERPPPTSVPWIKATLELVGEQWQKSAPIVGPFPQFVRIGRVSTPPRIVRALTVIRGVRVFALGRALRASTVRPLVVVAEQPIGYYADEVLSNLPEVFWRMEDGPDIPDHSGNGRTGFFEAWSNYQGLGVTKKIPGITGFGQRFDDYEVRYYDPDDFTLTVDFTIECWYQTVWTRAGSVYAMVNVASHQKAIGIQETPSGSGNSFLYARFGQSSSSTRTNVAPFSLVNDGQWHHLVLTRAAGSVRFYVDSVQTYASDVESAYTPNTYVEIYTGSYAPRVTDPISPGLDEVAYYDHALTASQVRRHYRSALERGDPPQAKAVVIGRALSLRVVQRLSPVVDQVFVLGRASRTSTTRKLTLIQGAAPGSPQFIALGRVVRTSVARTLAPRLKFDQVVTLPRVVRTSLARSMVFSSGILFSDSFNRPDGQLGTAEIGGPYAYPYGVPANYVTTGGALGVSTPSGSLLVTWPAAADFDTTLTLRQVGVYSSFLFRFINTSTYWKVTWKVANRTLDLARSNGSESVLGTAYLGDYVDGFLTPTIRVVGRGPVISVYLAGRLVLQAEDYNTQGTAQGVFFNSDATTRIESIETRRLVPAVVPVFDWVETELALILSASDRDGFIFKGRDSRQADEGLMA